MCIYWIDSFSVCFFVSLRVDNEVICSIIYRTSSRRYSFVTRVFNRLPSQPAPMARWLCHSLNGLVGTGFASRFCLHPRAGF